MIKTFGMLHKRGDISQDQFHAHWRGPHADHAVKLVPVMRRYVQNHRAPKPYPDFEPPADGCPEVWLDDLAAAHRLTTMPEYMTGAFIDEPAFMRVRSEGVLVAERVVIEGPEMAKDAALTKALFFLKRRQPMSRQAFLDFWLGHETPVLVGAQHALRWVKSPTLPELYEDGEPLYDGVEELWWASEADWKKDAGIPANGVQLDKFIDLGASKAMFVDENRVVWEG